MPRRNGTGPLGVGPMTGRGQGFCSGVDAVGYGAGFGAGIDRACRRGFGRGLGRGVHAGWIVSGAQTDSFRQQRDVLQKQLEAIDKQLGSL